jgi:amino acid permease
VRKLWSDWGQEFQEIKPKYDIISNMKKSRVRFLMAVYAIIGSTVGVGVFSIPYAIGESGILIGLLWMIGVAALNIIALLMYAEVIMLTPGHSRISGLARRYLGRNWAPIVGFLGFAHSWGAMLGYIVIGGIFLGSIFDEVLIWSDLTFQVLFAIGMSIILFGGLGFVAWVERYMVWMLVAVFGVMIIAGIPHIELGNITEVGSALGWFAPFGPLLFAFSSFSAMPEAMEILGKDRNKLRSVILVSAGAIFIFYTSFALLTLAVSGAGVSEEAIQGIAKEIGEWFLILGSLMGLTSVATSFILLGISIIDGLVYDFRIRQIPAWALTIAVPATLFTIGARDFVSIIGTTGAIFGGLVGLIVLWIYSRARKDICTPKRCLRIPRAAVWVVGLVYAGGVILQLLIG